MASAHDATLFLWGNCPELITSLKEFLSIPGLKVKTKTTSGFDYQVCVVDLSKRDQDLTDIFKKISAQTDPKLKTAIVIVDNDGSSESRFEYSLNVLRPLITDTTKNIRFLHTLDLYDPKSNSNLSQFQKLINGSVATKKIAVSVNGDHTLYLTAVPDLAKAINKSLFINATAGKIFTIIGEPLGDLEFAYLLKKTLEKFNFTLDIDINKGFKANSVNFLDRAIQTQAELNWLPEISISDSISEIVRNSVQPDRGEKVLTHTLKPLQEKVTHPDVSSLHGQEKRGVIKAIFVMGALVITLLAIPMAITAASLIITTRTALQSFQALRRGESLKAKKQLILSKNWRQVTTVSFGYLTPAGSLLAPQTTKNLNNYLLFLEHGQNVLESAINTFDLSNHLYLSLLGKESLGSDQTISAIKINLVNLNDNLSLLQLLLKDHQFLFGLDRSLENSNLNLQINILKQQITDAIPLIDIIERLISDKAAKHFVVLVQDNNELRASGGFINTVIYLSLESNRLVNIAVEPSLALDRLVEGNIPPPAPVRQLLNQANWSFRDSNVDANFEIAAKQITWFIERFKNFSVDGIITINLDFYKKLLAETGSVSLLSGGKVDSGNLSALASNPTVDNNNDVITAVSKILVAKITNQEIGFVPLARVLLSATATNETNLYFRDPTLEALAKKSGHSGNVRDFSCHPQLLASCQHDTIYLNEANFSVAKTNYYLKRGQNHRLEINADGQVKVTLNYDYSFPVPAPASIRAAYKAYYQFFYPTASSGLKIQLDDQDLDTTRLTQSTGGGLNKLEFSGNLALNQNHRLIISFISPSRLDLKSSQIAYSATFLKQSGTASDNFTYTLQYPDYLSPKILTLPMKTTSNHELTYETDSASNLSFGVLFKNQSL